MSDAAEDAWGATRRDEIGWNETERDEPNSGEDDRRPKSFLAVNG